MTCFLFRNCVNLISNIPLKCTDPLLAPLKKDIAPKDTKVIEYDGECMNAVKTILDFLLLRYELQHLIQGSRNSQLIALQG